KRERLESREQYWRSPSEKTEASPAKRICEDSKCRNVDVFSEIMCKMDFPHELIEEDLLCHTMKTLQQEIMLGGEGKKERDTVINKDCVESVVEWYTVELEYLLHATDDELGIPSTPQSEFVLSVNDDYGLFECLLQVESEAEH
ncbi:hypothetical protein KI387_026376, partial [Taxus chinensis]